MRIGPAIHFPSTTFRKNPFIIFEKPLCEKAAWSSVSEANLFVVDSLAAAVTSRPPKLWPIKWILSTLAASLSVGGGGALLGCVGGGVLVWYWVVRLRM